ncbi:hypothetical protein DFP94_103350 [Fontibacillus phaseoli]|uniref:Lipoprotein n=1 Tax=Fontibacillus phaseoli TaxID=1416533 RepID=A0A369BJ55_9BACL|nr:hypothetical protein [Fontibacillus phaseoli]RCX20618.1 hypothetical protein DFP94_103350 [Fontibacillus phaseoli]
MIQMKKSKLIAALVVSTTLVLSACGDNSETKKNDSNTVQENNPPAQNDNPGNSPNNGTGGEESKSAQDQLVAEFDALLQEGNKLPKAFDFIEKHADSLNPERVSHLLLSVEDAQIAALGSLADRFYEGNTQEQITKIFEIGDSLDELIGKATDEKLKALLTETKNSGYQLDPTEGMFNPDPDYRVAAAYAAKATGDVTNYMQLKAKESAERSLRDAALVIGWDELLTRALAAEDFTKQYPDSKRIKEIESMLTNYTTTIFYGANNTPLFSYDNKQMDPDAQKAYESALKEAVSGAGPLLDDLKAFMDAAAKNKYKLTEILWTQPQRTNTSSRKSLEQLRGELVPLNYE